MSANKGEKYKGHFTENIYEIVSDPFEYQGSSYVAFAWDGKEPEIVPANHFEQDHYTLIREPKFKVGDQVAYYGIKTEIVGVSVRADRDGDFWYLVDDEGAFTSLYESDLKAAE